MAPAACSAADAAAGLGQDVTSPLPSPLAGDQGLPSSGIPSPSLPTKPRAPQSPYPQRGFGARAEAQKQQLLSEPILSAGSAAIAAAIAASRAEEVKVHAPVEPPKPPWLDSGLAMKPAPPGGPLRGAMGGFHAAAAPPEGRHRGRPRPHRPQKLASLQCMGLMPETLLPLPELYAREAWEPGSIADLSRQGSKVAAAGVAAANVAKAEHGWSEIEEELEAIHNDSPEAAAKLSQVHATLLQRATALEAQLQTVGRAMNKEDSRAQRLSTQLQRTIEDRTRESVRLQQEFEALDTRQMTLEAHWLRMREGESDIEPVRQAAKIRVENVALREELELAQLKAELYRVEKEGRSLKEELRHLQAGNLLEDLDVRLHIGLDGEADEG